VFCYFDRLTLVHQQLICSLPQTCLRLLMTKTE